MRGSPSSPRTMHYAGDPRETITPESFAIDPQLLGLPLARPLRRAAAMAIDLVLVAVLVNAGGGLLFGVAAAWVFLRVSGRAAGGGAAVALFVVGISAWGSWRQPEPPRAERSASERVGAEAEAGEWRRGRSAQAGGPSADSLLRLYGAAFAAGDSGALDSLAPGLQRSFVADTVAALQARWERVRRENRRLRSDLEEAREDRGILSFMRASADDLGLTFGWAGLYFTAFLALWGGQTPGKRAMRIRVVRLDGKPMTWWASFERFGGYAASLVTGLLGFVQILWDRNRQGMHDKITETVVVLL